MSEPIKKVRIQRFGLQRPFFSEIYYRILSMSWIRFIFAVSVVYFCINLIFACLLYFSGENVTNATSGSFSDVFFFSVQTFATIGYGSFLPKTVFLRTH